VCLEHVNLRDRLGNGLRSFLPQIVLYAANDSAVRVFAREFVGVGAGVGVWRPVCVPSSVIVGTEIDGPAASWFSKPSYLGSPSASPSRQR
jgi:hypothetical protein